MTRMSTLPKAKKSHNSETTEQIKFVFWLRQQGYCVHHSPNGGKRSVTEGVKLKAMGVSAGFPDLFVPLARGFYHGFFLEMKAKIGGKVSPQQLEWLKFLRDNGYYAETARGFEEARSHFLTYISIPQFR